jgi:hypothetical protein
MATPAQLMQTMSVATGVPLPTVVDIDRRLVKGGLRTKGGRGFNAAQMTPLDAARLLTALLGSPLANASVEAVRRYARTEVDEQRSGETLYAATDMPELAALPTRHSFVAALATLITSATTGSLAQMMAAKKGWKPHIEIFAFTRASYGRVRLSGLPSGVTANVEYVLPPASASKQRRKKPRATAAAVNAENPGDLEQSRRVTELTILAIAKLLAEET